MKRRYLLAIIFLIGLISSPSFALEGVRYVTLHSGATADGDGASIPVNGFDVLGLDIAITNTATVTVQGRSSLDGAYHNVTCYSRAANTSTAAATASANFQCSVSGLKDVKAPISGCSSCTVSVKGHITTASSGGAGGGGGGGGVTTDIQDGAGDSVMDAVNNAVRVNIVAGAGSGGTAMTDDAAFTPGTTSITPAGAMFDDVTPDSVNEGDGGVLRMSANRNLYTTIRDAAGNERGINVDANGEIGIGAIRSALPAGTNAIGKLSSNSGVDIGDVDVLSVIAGTGATNLGKAEDAAHTTGDTGVAALSKRTDTAASSAGTDGDYATLNTDSTGRLWTNTEMPDAAALADNTANPTVPGVAAFLMCFDGTTWDRCQGGLTDTDDGTIAAAQVPSISVVIPYEYDGTNWTRPRGPNTVAHDAADAGNPIKIGAFAETSVSGATSVADGDRTNLKAGIDGVLLVRPHSNIEDRVSGTAGITDGSSTSVVAAQGAGIRFCATTIVISNSSATNVTVDIRDGTAGSVLMTIPAAANMGGGVVSLQTPLCTTANTIFAADPSASATTVAVSAVGFKTAL